MRFLIHCTISTITQPASQVTKDVMLEAIKTAKHDTAVIRVTYAR
jgi:hypothetical protein